MASPHEDRVRERAWEIWDGEGRPADRSMEHWLQAEREVGSDSVDGPVEAREGDSAPDETVETISDEPKPSVVTLTQPAPGSIETDG